METPKESEALPEAELIKRDKQLLRWLLWGTDGNRVMRWRADDGEKFRSSEEMRKTMPESVTEHNGGMLKVAVFLRQEAQIRGDQSILALNGDTVNSLIVMHDAHEVMTSDRLEKNEEDKATETAANAHLKGRLANDGFETLATNIDDYTDKGSAEARFVKVLDDLQAFLYMIRTKRFDMAQMEGRKGAKFCEEFPTAARLYKLAAAAITHPHLLSDDIADMPHQMT